MSISNLMLYISEAATIAGILRCRVGGCVGSCGLADIADGTSGLGLSHLSPVRTMRAKLWLSRWFQMS
jgi:hypothetical protein